MSNFFQLIFKGILGLFQHPWTTVLSLLAITFTVFLGSLFFLFLHNLDIFLLKNKEATKFQIYWQADADPEEVKKQWQALRAEPYLIDILIFSPEQALETLQDSMGGLQDLAWLKGRSPLPPTAVLTFNLTQVGNEQIKNIYDKLKKIPGVAKVSFNPLQVDMAHYWTLISAGITVPLFFILLITLSVIIGNTVRLSLLLRIDEIEILSLIGAASWQIRLPFIAGGVFQGLVGSLCAFIIMKILHIFLGGILNIPPLWIEIDFLSIPQCLLIVGSICLMSGLAAFLAVRKY